MSFADLERGGPDPGAGATGRGPPRGAPGSAPTQAVSVSTDAEYNRLKAQADRNIESLTTVVGNVGRILPLLGTKKDTKELQDKFHQNAEKVRSIAGETANLLQSMARLTGDANAQRIRKVQLGKMKSDLEKQLKVFADYQRTAKQTETKFVAKAEEILHHQQHESQLSDDGDERAGLLQRDREREEMSRLQRQELAINFNEELIEERHHNIAQIETEIQQVNDIFRDLATIVQEQGDMLDSIENNIESTVGNTGAAVVQLKKANEYQKSARSKICCLAVIVVIVAAVIAIPLILTQRSSSS